MTQNELLVIFNTIKAIMKKYEPAFIARLDLEGRYELWSEKEVFIAGKKRNEIAFAAIIIQSNYVGFYYMPIYTTEEAKAFFKPELLKLLKGKSCFHIKKNEPLIMEQIAASLEKGFELYKKNGWV